MTKPKRSGKTPKDERGRDVPPLGLKDIAHIKRSLLNKNRNSKNNHTINSLASLYKTSRGVIRAAVDGKYDEYFKQKGLSLKASLKDNLVNEVIEWIENKLEKSYIITGLNSGSGYTSCLVGVIAGKFVYLEIKEKRAEISGYPRSRLRQFRSDKMLMAGGYRFTVYPDSWVHVKEKLKDLHEGRYVRTR